MNLDSIKIRKVFTREDGTKFTITKINDYRFSLKYKNALDLEYVYFGSKCDIHNKMVDFDVKGFERLR